LDLKLKFQFIEKPSITFHDILPPQCITTADSSARAYYGQSSESEFVTKPAPDPHIIQGEKFGAIVRRSTPRPSRAQLSDPADFDDGCVIGCYGWIFCCPDFGQTEDPGYDGYQKLPAGLDSDSAMKGTDYGERKASRMES
jgi:hypothetical protein